MPLRIETFSNQTGGNAFFKALTHPLAAEKAGTLLDAFRTKASVAIYDPLNMAQTIAQAYDIESLPLEGYYVQDIEQRDRVFAGHRARLVTEISRCKAASLLVTAFDAARLMPRKSST